MRPAAAPKLTPLPMCIYYACCGRRPPRLGAR